MFKEDVSENGALSYECFGMIKSMPKFETESFKPIAYFANETVKMDGRWGRCVASWFYGDQTHLILGRRKSSVLTVKKGM